MQNLDTGLFETAPAGSSTNNASGIVNSVATSYVIERPSQTGKSNVYYVRLSDAEHAELAVSVRALDVLRTSKDDPATYVAVNLILDKNSGIWGSRLRKFSTLREVLEGVAAKLRKPHKYVRGRIGEDLSVKQLTAINQILSAIGVSEIAVPAR